MKQIFPVLTIAAAVCIGVSSCEESTSNVGSSLVQDKVEVIIDSAYTLEGRSVENHRVPSRTVTQLLGAIDAEGFGTMRSDIVTQFMPAYKMDTAGVTLESIDSLKLLLAIQAGGFLGDSLAPMGLKVYPLKKQLPYPIYSDFDPKGYYDEADALGARVYNAAGIGESDSVAALTYRYIYVTLPTDLAREFFTKYKTSPSTFAEPNAFANYFPGVYIANTYGSGRMMRIEATEMDMYYRQTLPKDTADASLGDTTYLRTSTYFAVTPEIVTNNNLHLTLAASLTDRMNAGEAIVVAPAGRDVEITFPIDRIIANYKAQSGDLAVINTLGMEIPVEAISNEYGIEPPENLLMVLSKEKDEFFEKNKLTDDKTSFYATYNTARKCYAFSGMRPYLLAMLNKEEPLTAEDMTFTLTPVSVQTETTGSSYYSSGTTYVTEITPMMTLPAMAKLDLKNAKIQFVFSKQTIKN